ncbi:MAG TPA: energy transducer TonB [Candidatus Krumholzibacteriaceae bacterium]|nr:energy transducer TonB [Candidatus Krumholzibacteriaceae bacterium]
MEKMKFSAVISLCIHALIFYALLTFFEIVPRVDLPDRVYSVRIFSPTKAKKEEKHEKKQEVEVEKPEPEPVEKKKPSPDVKDEKTEEPPEKQKEEEKEKKPLDVTVKEDDKIEETSVAVDAPRFPFSYYLGAIQRKVSANWFSASSKHGKSISCTVFFRLDRSGRISGLLLEKSSGDSYFDRAALRAIKSSAPFPPLPGAFDEPALGVHFRFVQKD